VATTVRAFEGVLVQRGFTEARLSLTEQENAFGAAMNRCNGDRRTWRYWLRRRARCAPQREVTFRMFPSRTLRNRIDLEPSCQARHWPRWMIKSSGSTVGSNGEKNK